MQVADTCCRVVEVFRLFGHMQHSCGFWTFTAKAMCAHGVVKCYTRMAGSSSSASPRLSCSECGLKATANSENALCVERKTCKTEVVMGGVERLKRGKPSVKTLAKVRT